MSIIDFFCRRKNDPSNPTTWRLYGTYLKRVADSDLYTLFGDDRWCVNRGFPIEISKGKKLLIKQGQDQKDFLPKIIGIGRKNTLNIESAE